MESVKPQIRKIIAESYPQIKELNPAQKAVVEAGFLEDDHNYIPTYWPYPPPVEKPCWG